MKTSKQRLKQLREKIKAERKAAILLAVDTYGIAEFNRVMREAGPKSDLDKFFSRLED